MSRLFEVVHAQRRAVGLVFVVVLVLGALAVARMPASILPEVTFPRITVIADAGELPAATMVREVTMPLEAAVRRIPHVREVRSTTSRGSAEINLDCDWGCDMDLALQRVQGQVEAVRAVLPAGTSLDARLMNPRLFPVLGYSLASPSLTPAQLRDLADFTLKPELARLPGVADVVVQGGRPLEARITLDPARLRARGLDVPRVEDAIRRATRLESLGLLESNARLYLGLADGRPRDLDDLRAIPVPVAGGAPVALRDLATIELADAPAFVRYRAQSREAVLVSLLRQPSASAITIADAARDWFRRNARRLPPDLRLQVFYDQSDLVRGSVGGVRDSLLVGALLAVLVIILFLRSARLGLAAATVLPGSIALTLLGLSLLGQSLDMMTLGGIAAAVGLVLDDAIVVVEHLAHRAGSPGAPGRAAALAELVPTLAGSTLCTLAIFLPFLFLGGVAGAFFRVLALAMSLMLGSSFALCLTVVPLLGRAARTHAAAAPAREGAGGPLDGLVRRPLAALAAVLVLLGAAVLLQRTLGSGFLPEMDEGALILDYISPPGTSITETDRLLQQVERLIDATPEVVAWSRRTGDQLGFFITEPNVGDYVLRLAPGRRRPADEVADALRVRIEGSQPALQIEFGQLVEDVIGDLTSNPQPVEVRVFGEDRDVLERTARRVAALVASIRGAVDVKDGIVVSGPDVSLAPSDAGARRGVTTEDLADEVTPAVGGVDLGEIVRGARAWPVRAVVRRPDGVDAASTLGALAVPAGEGGAAAVRDVATLRVNPGETEIDRDNLRTMVAVTARLSGRDLGSAVAEIQRRIRREVPLPPQVTLAYGGLWAEQQSSFRGLAGVLLGAVGLVVLILLLAFRSWPQILCLLGVVLASLAGVFAALHVAGATFNISSFVGAIMVVGIVAENGFFLLAEYRRRRREDLDARAAALAAGRRRTRPVLMTTIAGVAALAPLALGLGSGSALLRPLAIAVVGGFALSALLLLLVLPSLLARFGGGVE